MKKSAIFLNRYLKAKNAQKTAVSPKLILKLNFKNQLHVHFLIKKKRKNEKITLSTYLGLGFRLFSILSRDWYFRHLQIAISSKVVQLEC